MKAHNLLGCFCLFLSTGFLPVELASGPVDHVQLAELTAEEATAGLCARKFSAVQYAEALLARAEEWTCLNSCAYLNATQVLQDALAIDAKYEAGQSITPLCGLAFDIKDNIDIAGVPTSSGNIILEGLVPQKDSPLVTRLREANGVILSKSRAHEITWGATTINPRVGPVLNPYNVTHHPGGSSGGGAAMVAARLAPGTLCSDSGGSCGIPASITGITGFRPTMGCYKGGDGYVPLTLSRDTPGVMARTVGDVVLFNKVFSDCPAEYSRVSLSGLRLGLNADSWKGLQAEVEEVLLAAVARLKYAGAVIVPVDLSMAMALDDRVNGLFTALYDIPNELSRYLWRHGHKLSVVELFDSIATPPVKDFMKFLLQPPNNSGEPDGQAQALAAYGQVLKDANVDYLIAPTTAATASPIDATEPYQLMNGKPADIFTAYVQQFYETGIRVPGVSIPAGITNGGLPIGIRVNALPGNDGALLSVAAAIEAALPGTPPPPSKPQCAGCTASVDVHEVTFKGEGVPRPGERYSMYSLKFEGESCSSDLLQRAPLGTMPDVKSECDSVEDREL